MITEVKDILGNNLYIGDRVCWSEKSSTSTSYLKYGEIKSILKCKSKTNIIIQIIESGDNIRYKTNYYKCIQFPRKYHNIIKIR